MSKSEIKLFLSVDIFGSTKLKGAHNYSTILERCTSESNIINKLIRDPKKKISEKRIFQLNKDLIIYQDWSKIITDLFLDFNTEFFKYLESDEEVYPWKFAGDELIYCFDVTRHKDVYLYTLAFYKALRSIDCKYKETKLIRLKGSAWTAGFPVRNRIIETPIPSLFMKNGNGTFSNFPYPHIDYIGPEMDIGFRIGKNTYPGIIVISLELAYLLLGKKLVDSEIEEFKVYNVGWEPLKGVWNDKKYPVLWLQLPDTYNKSKELYYKLYNFWDREENHLLKNFDRALSGDKTEYIIIQDNIIDIISELNESITNIVIPYFCDDGEEIPAEHVKLLDFINFVNKLNAVNPEKGDSISVDTTNDVRNLLKKQS
ncbi:MAG: hypothetical protein MJ174_05965 [Treponema sp.]|nr:hypothetical protein [Treponema sp.]